MYAFRCTEQQLNDSLKQIEEAGDTLLHAVFKGGRDWMLICRKANDDPSGTPYAHAIREQTEAMKALSGRLRYIRDEVKAAEQRNRQAKS